MRSSYKTHTIQFDLHNNKYRSSTASKEKIKISRLLHFHKRSIAASN